MSRTAEPVHFIWQLEDGSLVGGFHQGDFDIIPSVGDRIVTPTAGEDPDGLEVVERYLVMDDVGEDRWYLVVKSIELNPVLVECMSVGPEQTKKSWDEIEKRRSQT
ncbi:hypothetical protein NLM16_01255 [Bradyrhizobium brasilense]|uniref:hypothetical protein n=1 Tax=Bradyrhizobium brasilense TaxID=1419277 RepID=UPI00287761DA|nr:hypothetical protein [Bradyrhizobium brasilense]MCP3412722.1 hypothetical protein [Bradyrhizobium brasilense]